MDQDLRRQIIDRIIAGYQPERIIMFGSQARGDAGAETDLNLVVIKDDRRARPERNREIRRLLTGIPFPVDVLLRTPEEFQRYREVAGSISWAAEHEGVIVYEQSAA